MPTTMNISLPDNLASFIEREVATGGYASQSEVVRDALRLLHREKASEQEKLEMLRRAVTIGVDDWRLGRVDDRPIDAILDEIDGETVWPPIS
jgi:antitoxin ParD1/3/4